MSTMVCKCGATYVDNALFGNEQVDACAQCSPYSRALDKRVKRTMHMLARHKERYVRAWLAATGIPPEQACIVTNMQPNGEVMVVKRRDEVLTCCSCHEPIQKDL